MKDLTDKVHSKLATFGNHAFFQYFLGIKL